MKATFPVLSDEKCRELYGDSEIVDSMMCAGDVSGGSDACQVRIINIRIKLTRF